MYKGKINLLLRNKVLHCGVAVRHDSNKLFSICNTLWKDTDKTYEGYFNEVTCKRCVKMLNKSDENGIIKL